MDKLFGREAAKIGRQIIDQAEPFNAAHTTNGPGPRKVDTSGVSYAAWVSVADVSASKVSGA